MSHRSPFSRFPRLKLVGIAILNAIGTLAWTYVLLIASRPAELRMDLMSWLICSMVILAVAMQLEVLRYQPRRFGRSRLVLARDLHKGFIFHSTVMILGLLLALVF